MGAGTHSPCSGSLFERDEIVTEGRKRGRRRGDRGGGEGELGRGDKGSNELGSARPGLTSRPLCSDYTAMPLQNTTGALWDQSCPKRSASHINTKHPCHLIPAAESLQLHLGALGGQSQACIVKHRRMRLRVYMGA